MTKTIIEVHGFRGLKSIPFRRTFKSHAAYWRWLTKEDGNVEILGYFESHYVV